MPKIEIEGAERTLLALDELMLDGEINANWYREQKAFIQSIANGIAIPDSFEAYSDLVARISEATDHNFEICNNARMILLY